MAKTAGACGRISSNIIAVAASRRCSFATISASAARRPRRQGSTSIPVRRSRFSRPRTRLPGAVQFNNAAIAVTLFLLWLERTSPHKDVDRIEAAIRVGLRDTQWPGRLEVIAQDPLTVIDVGHTPDGIRQSLAGLKRFMALTTGSSSPAHPVTRRPAGSSARWRLLRYDHLHGGLSQGRRAAGYRCRRAARQSGRGDPCPRYDRGRGASGPELAASSSDGSMSPAACSWRSNTPRPPGRPLARPAFFLTNCFRACRRAP